MPGWRVQEEYRHEAGTVVEVDFYNAGPLAGLSEEQLIQTTVNDYLGSASSSYCSCQIQDASVLRWASSAVVPSESKVHGMTLMPSSTHKLS